MADNLVTFTSDRVSISGPRQDNSLKISFETLEYDQIDLPKLFKLIKQGAVKVIIENE